MTVEDFTALTRLLPKYLARMDERLVSAALEASKAHNSRAEGSEILVPGHGHLLRRQQNTPTFS